MYHLTQSKGGISSIELGRRLGVTQTTAWKIKHKLMQAMMERDATKRLTGRIEIDDAYLGGERNGGKRGRGSPGKTPIVAAVETTPEGKPIRLKLRRVKGFRRAEIATLAQRNFHPASTVVSDGLHCFTGVGNAGCVHQPIITGSGRKAALNPAFKWVNTTLGNIKSAITGTYRTIRDKHVPRYLAEFEYRFNRRYDLAAMMPRLGYVAVRTPPMPYRLLKLAGRPRLSWGLPQHTWLRPWCRRFGRFGETFGIGSLHPGWAEGSVPRFISRPTPMAPPWKHFSSRPWSSA